MGSVFSRSATRSHAADQRRPSPPVYPGVANRHKTFCGTSSRSNGSSPLQSNLSPHVPTHRHTLHRQSAGEALLCDEWCACVACDSNCDLCSMVITPWQFGSPARVVREIYSLTGNLSAKERYALFSYYFSLSILSIVALFCREVKPLATAFPRSVSASL